MEASLGLSQNTTQTLMITQQMEQSIKILEMDTLELREYIQSMSLENPVIDIDGLQDDSPDALRQKKMEWLQQQALKDKQYVGYYDPKDDFTLEKTAAAPTSESLTDHLLHQAAFNCPPGLRPAVEHIIGFLDDHGYLSVPMADIAAEGAFAPELLEEALRQLQGFDPAGVGAADLSECLLLQLDKDDELERAIVAGHLELLAKNRADKLARELAVTEAEVQDAFARIRKLNPKPGSAFSPPDLPLYVTPDVLVTSFQDRYYVLPCEFSYPSFRMSSAMTDLMNTTSDKEVLQYIGQKIKQAQWVQRCIASRGETLLAVSKAIVQSQERFFRYGPQHLNILRMSDIAAMVEMHESTVSRAVRNKYLQCSHGTYPLRHFFVQGPKQAGSEDVSSHTIKCKIKEMIEAENQDAPLSDQKIADTLSAQGTGISRRTVAKYRDQLGIPNSAYRR